MTSAAPIFLIDVSAYLHRAMHVVYGKGAAETPVTDTSFIDHACVMLSNTMDKLGIKRMAIVADSVEPSLRHDEYALYKAKRKAHPPVYDAQAPRFLDALRDVSIAVIQEPRYEADDLIASLVGQEPETRYVVVTSDKDLFALVNDRVSVYNPVIERWYGAADVREKLGVAPHQVYDYMGLVGDTVDGIPGVAGIGPKTAEKLIGEFGTLDALYSRAGLQRVVDEKMLGDAMYKKLTACSADAFISRALAMPRFSATLAVTGHDELTAPSAGIVRTATSLARPA